MPDNKNQHYVPKCLLRNFSPGEERASLNVFNLSRGKLIPSASLKSQGSKNYFYGKDLRLEKALSGFEGRFAEFAKKLIGGGNMTEEELSFLRFFAWLQHRRTEVAIRNLEQSWDAMTGEVYGENNAPDPKPTHFELVVQSLKLCMDTRKFIADLKPRIVENRSGIEFVISDDPAVFTNRFAIQKHGNPGFGAVSSGAMLLLPISPEYQLLCYDGQVYTMPDIKGNRLLLKDNADAKALNEFQFIKASANVYFRNWDSRNQVIADFDAVKDKRKGEAVAVKTFVHDESGSMLHVPPGEKSKWYKEGTREEGKKAGRALIQLSFKQPEPNNWFAKLKYRLKQKTFYNGTAVGHVRKEEWLKHLE